MTGYSGLVGYSPVSHCPKYGALVHREKIAYILLHAHAQLEINLVHHLGRIRARLFASTLEGYQVKL